MRKDITILYVDDEPLNLQLFELNLGKNYNVVTTNSGTLGLNLLKTNPKVKIVISDMKMPLMNGVEFIRTAKKEFPDIPYFIVTGFEITEEIADALNEKIINRYFRKPFNMRDIESAIEEFLN